MENLNRQEINWIIQALESEASECNRVAKECSENSPECAGSLRQAHCD